MNRLLLALPPRILHRIAQAARWLQHHLHQPSDADRIAAAFDQIRPDLTTEDVNQAVTDYLTNTPTHTYRVVNPQLAEDQAETRWVGDEHGLRDLPPAPQQPPITLDPANPNTAVIRAALDEADFTNRKNHRTE
ncbi:hypothetical protein PQD13_gp21 [Gordonia phage Clawz]|uniref:Uncharacterized protein n=1 Tax=Gordonia phage Clawz TaxID=2743910 RepID=A0AAE7F818_9CAUD|nr:hypothetical protein PQD13_gp21 [Gordonia phage Clawz]QKY79933.1 hypothetical protein SEA_CLAWZ_21 [Gordonia phage Clawz]